MVNIRYINLVYDDVKDIFFVVSSYVEKEYKEDAHKSFSSLKPILPIQTKLTQGLGLDNSRCSYTTVWTTLANFSLYCARHDGFFYKKNAFFMSLQKITAN